MCQVGELKTEIAGGFGPTEFYVLWPGTALPRVPKGERYLCTYANKSAKSAKVPSQRPLCCLLARPLALCCAAPRGCQSL